MGEMADEAWEMALMDDYTWSDTVESYLDEVSNNELVAEVRTVLNDPDTLKSENETNKMWGILTYYRGYQRLTDKQRYALADFVLSR